MGRSTDSTVNIGVIVLPAFNAHATTAFIDPFRAANYLSANHLYRWQFMAPHESQTMASNGMLIATTPIAKLTQTPDILLISASWNPERYQDKALLKWIRQCGLEGALLCAVDTGAFLLGVAGLLDGYRVTVHYEHMDAFSELYPHVALSEDIFVQDRNILTCCGGAAATDMALAMVQNARGTDLANAAARYIFHDRLRAANEGQNAALHEPVGYAVDPTLREAIILMERNLETPLPIPEIAQRVNRSQRQLERLFKRYTRVSAARYYLDIRLDRARGLITQTELRVLQVAIACGFSSAVHFARAYRKKFGLAPRDDRAASRVPFEFRAFPMHAAQSRDANSNANRSGAE